MGICGSSTKKKEAADHTQSKSESASRTRALPESAPAAQPAAERRSVAAQPPASPPRRPQPRDLTAGKKWPGTYNLGVDKQALTQAVDRWQGPARDQRLVDVSSEDKEYVLTAEKRLGAGAQGGVWKCYDKDGNAKAVKVFDKAALKQEQIKNCLHNPAIWHEYQLLRRVGGHAGVVSCDGIVLESRHHFFISMEYVQGVDLHQRLWNGKGMNIPVDPKHIYRGTMEAFAFCHSHKVAHRDLKPTNVMLSASADGGPPTIKVMDFGFGAEIPETEEGAIVQMRRPVGTTAWAAPEVLELYCTFMQQEGGLGAKNKIAGTDLQDDEGLGYYARPADVWSSGVLLWEVLTSDHLFHRPRDRGARRELKLVLRWESMPKSLEQHQVPVYEELADGRRAQDGRKAQQLMARILVRDPQARPTAADILRDPWLAG